MVFDILNLNYIIFTSMAKILNFLLVTTSRMYLMTKRDNKEEFSFEFIWRFYNDIFMVFLDHFLHFNEMWLNVNSLFSNNKYISEKKYINNRLYLTNSKPIAFPLTTSNMILINYFNKKNFLILHNSIFFSILSYRL